MSNSKRFLPRLRRYMDEGDRRQHRLGTLLYALSGVMCGIGLAIMMPATMALQSGDPQWSLTFWGWAVALAAVTVVGSTASFFGTKLSYAAGLGFMRNMQVVIGNKVSRLPLGWFKADSAGRLSRMVTQEMISTGQAAALYVGQLIKNAAAAIVFCAAVWLWSWQIGIMLTLSIPILFLLLRVSQACVGKGNGLEDSAERDIAARIVEFARCQGALRACRAGADYEELESSFVEGRKRSIRGLWWSALGEILSGTSVQMLVVSMIIAVSYLGASGSIGALETVVMIGVALRFTTLLNEIASALFGMEDRRAMLDGIRAAGCRRVESPPDRCKRPNGRGSLFLHEGEANPSWSRPRRSGRQYGRHCRPVWLRQDNYAQANRAFLRRRRWSGQDRRRRRPRYDDRGSFRSGVFRFPRRLSL